MQLRGLLSAEGVRKQAPELYTAERDLAPHCSLAVLFRQDNLPHNLGERVVGHTVRGLERLAGVLCLAVRHDHRFERRISADAYALRGVTRDCSECNGGVKVLRSLSCRLDALSAADIQLRDILHRKGRASAISGLNAPCWCIPLAW